MSASPRQCGGFLFLFIGVESQEATEDKEVIMASTIAIDPKAWEMLTEALKQDPKFVNFLVRGGNLENLARVRRTHQLEFDRNPPDGISRATRPRGVSKRLANWA